MNARPGALHDRDAVAAGLGRYIETPRGRKVETFVGFHTLRKTCGTRLLVEMDPVLKRPWVIDEVQAMLGHTERATMAKYYIAVKPETLPPPRSAPRVGTGWEQDRPRHTEITSRESSRKPRKEARFRDRPRRA